MQKAAPSGEGAMAAILGLDLKLETALMEVFKERDPLSVGFESVWTLRLLRKLLSWDPSERPTAGRALEHAFFRDSENAGGWMCVGDANERQYEWKSDCAAACVGTCA